MIPNPWREGRYSGTGGGGRCASGGITPYFCKKCGKTKPASQFMANVDVCKSCRIGKKRGK